MKILILFLISTSVQAGAFAELAFTARQQTGRLPDETITVNGAPYNEHFWRMYDVNYTKNPYCSVMVGYQWNLKPNFDLGLSIHHESSIATGKDRGINDLRLSIRWHE